MLSHQCAIIHEFSEINISIECVQYIILTSVYEKNFQCDEFCIPNGLSETHLGERFSEVLLFKCIQPSFCDDLSLLKKHGFTTTCQRKQQAKYWLEAGRNAGKKIKNYFISQKSDGLCLWGFTWCGANNHLEKGKTISGQYDVALLEQLNEGIKPKDHI